MRSPAFVCLSLCLSARLLKNSCMHLDEILRVDRCRDMDELINLWARSGHSLDAGTGFLSRISYTTLLNFADLPSLAYFSAISVSICAKLARSILMTDRNMQQSPIFEKRFLNVEFCRRKTVTCTLRTSTSSNTAAVQV